MSKREEDFRKRAEQFADETSVRLEEKYQTRHDYLAGEEYGYQYALQHPQWKSVEEELPMHDVEENGLITYQEVLVSLYDGCVDTDTYDTQLKAWWRYEGEVEYWMPKPQPPRKEDK